MNSMLYDWEWKPRFGYGKGRTIPQWTYRYFKARMLAAVGSFVTIPCLALFIYAAFIGNLVFALISGMIIIVVSPFFAWGLWGVW